MTRFLFSELTKSMKAQAVAMMQHDDDDPTDFKYAVDINNNVIGFQPKAALQLAKPEDPLATFEKGLRSAMVDKDSPDPVKHAQELTANDPAEHERKMEALAESSIARAPAKQVEALKETAKEADSEPDPVLSADPGIDLTKVTSGLRTANKPEIVK